MSRLLVPCLLLCAVGSTGCTEPGTACTLDSSELVLSATAIDQMMSWNVEIIIERSGDVREPLKICGEDEEILVNGSAADEEVVYGVVRYLAEVDAGVDEIEVVYRRGGGEELSATVSPPPMFELTNPEPGDSVSRSAGVEVRWSPAGPPMTDLMLELAADDILCLDEWSEPVPDVGNFMLGGGEIMLGSNAMSEGTTECDAELRLIRRQDGEVDAALDPESQITALRRRGVRITSVP